MKIKFYIFIVCALLTVFTAAVFPQKRVQGLNLQTEPNATVWIDGVKRGVTDSSGKLEIKPVGAGIRSLQVRAFGFQQAEKKLTAAQRGAIKIDLVKTADQAELAFQEAEKVVDEDKSNAIELYKKAVSLRPNYAEAYLGLARALTEYDNEAAHSAIASARKIRPIYPEASAVEGRIFRSDNEIDKAIESFDRAVREGKGFQPEAHTGLGLIFQNEAEGASAEKDFDDEKYYYGEAAKSFEKAIDQLSATEPVLYMLLGSVYEKMEEKKKAIAVYQRFIRDFPASDERSVAESFIVQLKKEIAEKQ